jgi:hypothetical protein
LALRRLPLCKLLLEVLLYQFDGCNQVVVGLKAKAALTRLVCKQGRQQLLPQRGKWAYAARTILTVS